MPSIEMNLPREFRGRRQFNQPKYRSKAALQNTKVLRSCRVPKDLSLTKFAATSRQVARRS